jgi:hypothetical protein
MEVVGRVLGKESSVSAVNKLRAILPLPALMQVVDVLLPLLLEQHLSAVLPRTPGCLVAGRPGSQVLDISHAVQCVLEKGLDDFGAAAAAQCDIQQFYDSLPLILILLWLVDKGVPSPLVAAAIRHQMCPQVTLVAGAARAVILDRCVGGLTGSRVAGMLARIPVESCLADRAAFWRKWGFRISGDGDAGIVLCCATYIDNCFAVSRTPAGAVAILEDLEESLWSRRNLTMKPSSRSYVEALGGSRGVLDEAKWPRQDTFNVLGHSLQHTGSVRHDWVKTRRQMWGAFWANSGAAGAKKLPVAFRLKLLFRAVVPIFDFRCSRWPPQASIAAEVDTLQRKMTGILLRLSPMPREDVQQFVRRRGRAARSLCAEYGWWSKRWFKRTVAWDAHVKRECRQFSWSGNLVEYRAQRYLAERRAFHNGRTATRTNSGFVCRRWHDGVAFARETLA